MSRPPEADAAPRRIAIVSDAWHPQINGVVRTLAMVAAELRRAGHSVLVIGPDRFRTLPCPVYPEIRLALWPRRRLAAQLAAFAPDSLHIATEGPLGHAACAIAGRAGWSFTTAYHTSFPDYLAARFALPRRLTYRWLRGFHGRGAGLMVATPALATELAGRGFANLNIWSRGVDLAAFHPQNAVALPYPRPIFLSVGRLAVEKNLPAFLALDLPGSKLVVGDGPARAALMRDFPEAHFLGARQGPALARLYASADAFVFPSRTDTFGLVLLEALASGLPVAAFPTAAPRAVLGRAYSLVGALDGDLGRAARAALTRDRNACRRFAEGFSWAHSARQFLANLVPLHASARQAIAPPIAA